MSECVFCKIIKKEVPSDIVFENERVIVFKDINPKAKVHLLVVPKEHITSIKEIKEENKTLIAELIFVAKKIAEEQNLTGYKLIFNVGREGGQLVDHIHLHLVSGDLREMP